MKKVLFILSAVFVFYSCSKDDCDNTPSTEYLIVNNGNGGVFSANDEDDSAALNVVQAIPEVENTDYSKTIPIILFFDDKININSLEESFEVTQNGNRVGGTVSINEGANGFAILTFSPSQTFDSNASILLNIEGLEDDGGNTFPTGSYSLSYETNSQTGGDFDENNGFENMEEGVLFLGDGSIMQGTQGCVSPVGGDNFAAITTGDMLISNGNAIGSASSMMVLGSINGGISSLSFEYNFLSAEFNEYVDSVFDDSVIVTIIGPDGAHSEFLTSVNTVGITDSECTGFPNMPDTGDGYAGETGWTSGNMSFSNVGSPAYVIFTVSDVSDHIYSSVLAVDNISY